MNPNETPASIFAWAQNTFNKPDIRKTASRGGLEVTEMIVNAMHGKPNIDIAAELADVTVMLWQVVHQLGEVAPTNIELSDEQDKDIDDMLPAIPAYCHKINLLYAALLSGLDVLHYRKDEGSEFQAEILKGVREVAGGLLHATEQLADALGVDLQSIVDTKMQVNRSRQWKMDAHGHAQHI